MNLNCLLYVRSVEDIADAAASAQKSPSRASFVPSDEFSRKGDETKPRPLDSVPIGSLVEKLDLAAAQQAKLVAQLKAHYSGESSRLAQKDEEIALLKAQLANAHAEVRSTNLYAQKLAEEKVSLLAQVSRVQSAYDEYKSNCHWALKFVEQNKSNHFAKLDELIKFVNEALERQEGKLRKLSIDYDEELYPHLLSTSAERRYSLFLCFL